MKVAERVGANLRTYRKAAGLSQGEVAARLGVSQAALSAWEAGKREAGYERLAELASTYGVTIAEVFEATPSEPTPSDPLAAEVYALAAKIDHRLSRGGG